MTHAFCSGPPPSPTPPPAGVPCLRIGLTGGIGSGKSTVAALWRREGVRVIDLDACSRAVLDVPGDGVEEAIDRFGEELRTPGGTVDRSRMARIVFADPGARADLEQIVLPRVHEAVADQERAALEAGEPLVVHDSPLLLETGQEQRYGAVVGVLARREDRIDRVVRDRGRTREYVESILAAQVTDLERIRRCDLLILNTTGREVLAQRALRMLERAGALASQRAAAEVPRPPASSSVGRWP
ncbi:dephospho-CoA kinase [Brachybacterium nesterenkovii]|uniref:dephospho-CoA kinase n=1 Tax=Brachybacterium nesterenkovii TaxID=47847 RepID=UPI00321A8A51